jgi:hypothetical protein
MATGDALREGFLGSPLLLQLTAIAEGRKAVPESAAIRHHFIPQFLLRRFSIDGTSGQRIMQLDLRSGEPRSVSIERAASRRRLYSARNESGEKDNRVETWATGGRLL